MWTHMCGFAALSPPQHTPRTTLKRNTHATDLHTLPINKIRKIGAAYTNNYFITPPFHPSPQKEERCQVRQENTDEDRLREKMNPATSVLNHCLFKEESTWPLSSNIGKKSARCSERSTVPLTVNEWGSREGSGTHRSCSQGLLVVEPFSLVLVPDEDFHCSEGGGGG